MTLFFPILKAPALIPKKGESPGPSSETGLSDVSETGSSGDKTWSSPVKFDNETVEKRFIQLTWNRSVLK